MLSIIESLLIFVAVSESILGLLGNGFIGLVSCIDGMKNKKISTISFILTGLAISRFCLIWTIVTDGFLKLFSPDVHSSGNLIEYNGYLCIVMNQSSIWFATCLSIFYFLKISSFSHRIFLWLKGRLNMVLFLLLGCLLISWLVTFPHFMKIAKDNRKKNKSTVWSMDMHKDELFGKQIWLHLGVILLFILCLITCVLLITSLWRHNRRMQLNATGFRDLSTEAHIKAMKVLVSFIILFILNFVGTAIQLSSVTVPENKRLFIFGMTTTVLYLWGHSLTLILGNRKLKQASLRMLKPLKCWEKEKLLRTP